MDIVLLIVASLAALVHVYIFILETFLWTKPAAQKVFGIPAKQALVTKEMAANQGVYNGALAVIVFAGVAISLIGYSEVGHSFIFAGTAVMTIAALYLFASASDKRAAALKQLLFPLATIAILAFLL